MHIRFLSIKLNNFFSFENAELNLDDMGYTLVEGRNYCKLDSAYSNGSGKSSIFNGICFALTGETAQGISTGVENIFADPSDCWVELAFKVDNDDFVLRRYKTPRTDLKIWVNGEDMSGKGIRESTKLLASYLPDLTSTLINSIIILGQGLPNRFTNNHPARRKEILETLTKSDFMIQSIKDKLELRQTELRMSLRENEDKLLSSDSQLSVYKNQLRSYNKELEAYKEFENSELSISSMIVQVQSALKESEQNTIEHSEKIEELNKNLDVLNEKYQRIIVNRQSELDDLLAQNDLDMNDLQEEMTELNSSIKVLSNEIKKLDSITDICPTCGQKIPDVNKPDTTEDKEKLKRLKDRYKDYEKKLAKLKTFKSDTIKDFNSATNSTIANLSKEIDSIKSEIKDRTNLKDRELREQVKLSNEITRLTNLSQNYVKLLSDIGTIEDMISETTKNSKLISESIIDIKNHLDIVQQMVTLAKREFRGILLTNVIEYINKKVKQYSKEVFDTEELNFSLDDNAIDISYCGKPYENLSGGEKQKIDVIVQLALRDILSRQLNIHSNLLVCDEVLDNLDALGCSKIISLISNLTDIDSVFIISHHTQDLELTKDNSILVEKDESGISTIKFV